MKCPYCGQQHPDNLIECPSTGKILKRSCSNEECPYFGEHIWLLEKESCPCCGQPLTYIYHGHEYVDLGLRVKWATCNIGARTPEEYGNYFAWGETSPKSDYEWSNLKYCDDKEGYSFSKYNQSDNMTVLEQIDDAARTNWGSNWRMPSDSDFQELLDKCTWEWTKRNNIEGYKVTSKVNGNSIFLPAAGWKTGINLLGNANCGCYCSDLLNESKSLDVCGLSFTLDEHKMGNHLSRHYGRPVRPVFSPLGSVLLAVGLVLGGLAWAAGLTKKD